MMADELRVDLEGIEVTWSLFEDFRSGLEEMSSQDWITFRCCALAAGRVTHEQWVPLDIDII